MLRCAFASKHKYVASVRFRVSLRFGSLKYPAGANRHDAEREAFIILKRHVLQTDSAPVTSRFFTFSSCVAGLLRALLIGLPHDVFSVNTIKPHPRGQKRLELFHKFYKDSSSLSRLKVASLALQVTAHATALTAQKGSSAARTPTIILSWGFPKRGTQMGPASRLFRGGNQIVPASRLLRPNSDARKRERGRQLAQVELG